MSETRKGEMLSKMIRLAAQQHDGQFDKAGQPYILHVLKVMHKLRTNDEELQIIALGHDLIEDSRLTYYELKEMGFSDRVIYGIHNLTKIKGETEDEYLTRVESSEDSIRVKLADLQHNSDIRRLKGLEEKDFKRMQKYHRMYVRLYAALEKF